MNAPLPAGVLPAQATELRLQVRAVRLEAVGVHGFELRDPDGALLPEVQAGAHVDVHLRGPGGALVRSYSLAGDPADRTRWLLGVLREAQGGGGSRAMHDSVRVGDVLRVGSPRNAFAMVEGAVHTVLLAGGIGITPLKAMVHALVREGRSFELHYCARSERHAAFVDELRALVDGGSGRAPSPAERERAGVRVDRSQRAMPADVHDPSPQPSPRTRGEGALRGSLHLHFDGGDVSKGLDIAALLAAPAPGTHLYYCGPAGFMKACADASAHWPAGTVHFEHFKPPEPAKPALAPGAFEVRLARAGITLQVQPEQTIVRAIELAGLRVPTSCLSGLCGSCKVDYLEGEVEHNDYILNDEQQRRCLTVCVSRARSSCLVLDL